MASAEKQLEAIPAPSLRQGHRVQRSRFFFIAMGFGLLVVAAFGFGPHLRQFFAGTRPISAVAHVHGVLMTSWLLTFIAQATFAAKRRMDLHRKIGSVAIVLGTVIWLSLIGMTIRGYATEPYPLAENIFYSLPQLYIIVVFGPLFLAAVKLRGNPSWHKRVMVIATIPLLQAAVDRFSWLPSQGPGHYLAQILCLDALLVPLIVYDLAVFKRLHPATIVAGGVLIAVQCATALIWQ